MQYEWLRRNGDYISSALVEGMVQLLGDLRCKQTGKH